MSELRWTQINWDELLMNWDKLRWTTDELLMSGLLLTYPRPWPPWASPPSLGRDLPRRRLVARRKLPYSYQFVIFPSELQYATGCYRVLLFPPSLEVSTLGGRCWSWLVPRSLCYFGRSLESSALESLWLPWWRLSSYFDSSYFSVNLPFFIFCIACAIENV